MKKKEPVLIIYDEAPKPTPYERWAELIALRQAAAEIEERQGLPKPVRRGPDNGSREEMRGYDDYA